MKSHKKNFWGKKCMTLSRNSISMIAVFFFFIRRLGKKWNKKNCRIQYSPQVFFFSSSILIFLFLKTKASHRKYLCVRLNCSELSKLHESVRNQCWSFRYQNYNSCYDLSNFNHLVSWSYQTRSFNLRLESSSKKSILSH